MTKEELVSWMGAKLMVERGPDLAASLQRGGPHINLNLLMLLEIIAEMIEASQNDGVG